MPPNDPINLALTPPDIGTDLATLGQGDAIGAFDTTLPFVDDPNGVYLGISITSYYVFDMGLRCAPVAGAKGTPAVFWRVHAGICFRAVDWVLKKIGAQPVPPNSDTGTDNEVLVDKIIAAGVPEQVPSGEEVFVILGRYLYWLQVPPADTDPLMIPRSQLRIASSQNVMIPATWVRDTIGPVTPPSGFQGGQINF